MTRRDYRRANSFTPIRDNFMRGVTIYNAMPRKVYYYAAPRRSGECERRLGRRRRQSRDGHYNTICRMMSIAH